MTVKKITVFKNAISYLLIGTAAGSLAIVIPLLLIFLFNDDINSLQGIMRTFYMLGLVYACAFAIGAIPALLTGIAMSYDRFAQRGAFEVGFTVTSASYTLATFIFSIFIYSTNTNTDGLISFFFAGLLWALVIGVIGGLSSVVSSSAIRRFNIIQHNSTFEV